MSVNENSFFQYNETRGLSGYKSAWLVKRTGADKYSLVGATETVPYVFGDKDTFEFDLLQSPTKGQVEGKPSLEPKDIEVLHHRDNAYRFGKMKGKVIDFMTINAEFVGYKYTGTLDYRPNDAEADVNRATVTITPMSAQTIPIYDARDEVEETLYFANSIPATITAGETVDFSVEQSATISFDIKKIAPITNAETAATKDTDFSEVTGSGNENKRTFLTSGLYAITVSATGYASWTTTVYVESAT